MRTKRSTAAPLAFAFFSLTLVAVHASVELVGANISYGSRFASMTAAWRQVGGVFLSVYQPSNAAQLLALHYTPVTVVDKDVQNSESLSTSEFACLTEPSDADPAIAQVDGSTTPSESVDLPVSVYSLHTPLEQSCARSSSAAASAAKRERAVAPKKSQSLRKGLRIRPFELGERVRQLSFQGDDLLRLIDRHLFEYRIQVGKSMKPIDLAKEAKLVNRRSKEPTPACDSKVESVERPARQSNREQPAERLAPTRPFDWKHSQT